MTGMICFSAAVVHLGQFVTESEGKKRAVVNITDTFGKDDFCLTCKGSPHDPFVYDEVLVAIAIGQEAPHASDEVIHMECQDVSASKDAFKIRIQEIWSPGRTAQG